MTRRTSGVIAEAVRRSALADYKNRFAALSAARQGDLSIRELPFVAQINLRADPNDAGLMRRLTQALGFALPVTPNAVASKKDRHILRLGPDEWLVVGEDGQQDAIETALRGGLDGVFAAITDVSANRTVLEISGLSARHLLAHGMPIDLDARAFGSGRCAQTLLAKAQVIIERRDNGVFCLYVRTSFAGYVADWLLDGSGSTPA